MWPRSRVFAWQWLTHGIRAEICAVAVFSWPELFSQAVASALPEAPEVHKNNSKRCMKRFSFESAKAKVNFIRMIDMTSVYSQSQSRALQSQPQSAFLRCVNVSNKTKVWADLLWCTIYNTVVQRSKTSLELLRKKQLVHIYSIQLWWPKKR